MKMTGTRVWATLVEGNDRISKATCIIYHITCKFIICWHNITFQKAGDTESRFIALSSIEKGRNVDSAVNHLSLLQVDLVLVKSEVALDIVGSWLGFGVVPRDILHGSPIRENGIVVMSFTLPRAGAVSG